MYRVIIVKKGSVLFDIRKVICSLRSKEKIYRIATASELI